MKKFAVIVGIAVFVIMLASSCNQHTCPAYSQADTQTTEQPA